MKKKIVQLLSAGIAFAVVVTTVPAIPAFAEESTEAYSDSEDDSDDDAYEEPWRLYIFPDRPGEYYISPNSNFKYEVDTKKGELTEVLIDSSKAVLLPEDPTGVWKPNPDGNVGEIGTIVSSSTWLPEITIHGGISTTKMVELHDIFVPGTYAYQYFHPQEAADITGIVRYDYAFEVLKLVNKEREKAGLKPYVMADSLLPAAMARAAELEVEYTHSRPNHLEQYSGDIFHANPGDSGKMPDGSIIVGGKILHMDFPLRKK